MGTKTKVEAPAKKAVRKIGAGPKSVPTERRAAEKKPVGAKTSSPNSTKAARQSRRSSRTTSGALVCRYCGSDDLAPSFKKRRDARCRACFKKRYGSKAGEKSKRAGKTKASK